MEEQWVVGLSIDEEIVLGASRIKRIDERYEFVSQTQPEKIFHIFGPEETLHKIPLERMLRSLLVLTKEEDKKFYSISQKTLAIGVSTIGLVNRDTLRLTDIARKNWVDEVNDFGERSCVIDFNRLFDEYLFPNLGKMRDIAGVERRFINVHNDATAGCFLEYINRPSEAYDTKVLFYIMVSEGINGGLVIDGWPFTTELHPEIGHMWPRLHPKDQLFNLEHSGCPVHKFCFEGVASGARIRNSWGKSTLHNSGRPKNLWEIGRNYPDNPEHPWHIIAYYIAQLCMNATLAVSPGGIIIGGEFMFPDLILFIRKYFQYFNSGGSLNPDGSRRDYVKYEAMLKEDFIQIARVRENERVRAALELARLTAQHPLRALRTVKSSSLASAPKRLRLAR